MNVTDSPKKKPGSLPAWGWAVIGSVLGVFVIGIVIWTIIYVVFSQNTQTSSTLPVPPDPLQCFIAQQNTETLIRQPSNDSRKQFGYAVAVSKDGLWLGIGAPGNGEKAGKVYLYRLEIGDNTTYNLFKTFSEGPKDGNFGASICFSYQTLNQDQTELPCYMIVGAPTHSQNEGRIYIFQSSGKAPSEKWNRIQEEGSNTKDKMLYGTSVAIAENASWIAVGAVQDFQGNGSVFMYKRLENGKYQYTEKLLSSIARDFGRSCAFNSNGTQFVVGAPLTISENDEQEGRIFVYRRSDNLDNWNSYSNTGYYSSLNSPTTRLGTCVAINFNGNRILAGGPNYSHVVQSQDFVSSGAAFVFELDNLTWKEASTIFPPTPKNEAKFGFHVALCGIGDVAYISAPTDFNDPDEPRNVFAYAYNSSSQTFELAQTFANEQPSLNSRFGFSIDVTSDSSSLFVGNPDNPNLLDGVCTWFRFVRR